MVTRQQDFNNVPLHFCSDCLSLKIKVVDLKNNKNSKDKEISYCEPCGSTNIAKEHISIWEAKYVAKYGKKFLIIRDKSES